MDNARLSIGLPLLLGLALPAVSFAAPPMLPDDQAALKAHVMFLASDAMRGREAGSAEYDIAAEYVAAQFYAAGLAPAGDDGGYLQRVPLVSYRPAGRGDFVWTAAKGLPAPLVSGADFVPAPDPAAEATSRAGEIVFVGQGLVAPRYGRDDYRGVDVRGRIVAFTNGAPASFSPEERAHFAEPETKALSAADHGAVGYLIVDRRGFGAIARANERERVTWATPAGVGAGAGAPPLGTLSEAGAAKLFGADPNRWEQALAAAEAMTPGRPLRARGTLTVATRTAFAPMPSSNVAGLLPGTDPRLKDEIVVLSAHLDHVGVGAPVDGDTIYNGAEDNAVGIAALIEAAKRFKASGRPPRRSILFLAVTAEEKGLVGSDYFARHPTVPIERIVADVNFDMPIITYPFEDMTGFGTDRSTLGPVVAAAAASIGVTISPDPAPDMGLFVRSDHYRFVQQGVPSVLLWPAQKGAGKAAWADFFAHRYHKPSDDLSQPLDWAQGVRFVTVNYTIARAIADADDRPVWNRGDFFGTLYKGPMAK